MQDIPGMAGLRLPMSSLVIRVALEMKNDFGPDSAFFASTEDAELAGNY